MPTRTRAINRTCYSAQRRVMGWEAGHADTVRVGPSASENAEGAEALPTPGPFSRNARATEAVRYDSEVTAVLQRTRTPSSGDRDTPTSVYRYYDRLGALIYVGITNRGVQRNLEHNLDKDWWQFVVRQEVDHCATREDALRRERALIIRHRPPFNRQHNPDSDNLRAIYLAFTSAAPGGGDPLATWKDAGKQVAFGIHSVDVAARELVLRTDVALAPVAQRIRAEEDLHLYHRKDQGHRYGSVTFEGGCVQDLAYLVALKFARYIPPFRSAHAPVRVVSLKQPVTFRLTAVYLKWETYGERPNGAVA